MPAQDQVKEGPSSSSSGGSASGDEKKDMIEIDDEQVDDKDESKPLVKQKAVSEEESSDREVSEYWRAPSLIFLQDGVYQRRDMDAVRLELEAQRIHLELNEKKGAPIQRTMLLSKLNIVTRKFGAGYPTTTQDVLDYTQEISYCEGLLFAARLNTTLPRAELNALQTSLDKIMIAVKKRAAFLRAETLILFCQLPLHLPCHVITASDRVAYCQILLDSFLVFDAVAQTYASVHDDVAGLPADDDSAALVQPEQLDAIKTNFIAAIEETMTKAKAGAILETPLFHASPLLAHVKITCNGRPAVNATGRSAEAEIEAKRIKLF